MKTGSIEEAQVRVQVVLGEASLSVRELSGLAKGSIIELESIAGEPVEFLVAGQTLAKGEVVIIDEHFGIRLTELQAETAMAEQRR